MADPLRIGMLGYRFMGKAHANALARLPMFFPDAPAIERHTLIGRDKAALAGCRQSVWLLGDRNRLGSRRRRGRRVLQSRPEPISTPSPRLGRLEAGTPVFCEKPLAAPSRKPRQCGDAAAAADVPAGCAFNYRFVPAVQYAKQLIDSGELGEIRHVRGQYLQDWLADPDAPWAWRMDADLAGSGALGDLGAHTVDLACFLVGDQAGEIERVSGQLQTFVDERPVYKEDGETSRSIGR